MEQFSKLAEFGSVGIAIALVALIAFMVREFIKVITNHLQHTNDTMSGLQSAITELVTYLKTINKRR